MSHDYLKLSNFILIFLIAHFAYFTKNYRPHKAQKKHLFSKKKVQKYQNSSLEPQVELTEKTAMNNQNNINDVVNQIQKIANDKLQRETYYQCRADCYNNPNTWEQNKNCRRKCVDAGNIWGDRFYSHRLPIKNAIMECVTFCHEELQNNNIPKARQMSVFKQCADQCPMIIDPIVTEAGAKINKELERIKREIEYQKKNDEILKEKREAIFDRVRKSLGDSGLNVKHPLPPDILEAWEKREERKQELEAKDAERKKKKRKMTK